MNETRMREEMSRPRDWFRSQESGDHMEIYVYDVVGPEWWEEGKRTIDLVREIAKSKAKSITVRINSPGGSVFDGMAIYNALRDKGVPITTIVDGMAASIASIILAAGDTRRMGTGTMAMIHNAWGVVVGDFNDMEKMSGELRRVNEQLVGVYAKLGGTAEDWREMMAAETYFDADEAIEFGLATEKADDMKIAACGWGLDILPGAPVKWHRRMSAQIKRERERVLRDEGLSARDAKRALAEDRDDHRIHAGWAHELRRNISILNNNASNG